jgi:transposase
MGKTITDLSSVSTIGLDVAKYVFQVHGVDAVGQVIVARSVRHKDVISFFESLPPCLVGMEACSSSHHWARELRRLGHEVRLIPPSYVKAYVRRQKNDAADAAAICEAVTRPSMRFVPVKTVEQQGVLMLHRARELLVSQRTGLINALRGHLAEFGIVAAQGARKVAALIALVADQDDDRLPDMARVALTPLVRQIGRLENEIDVFDRRIGEWHRANAASRRLGDDPRYRSVNSLRHCGERDRPLDVRLRSRACCFLRPRAASVLDRRQGAARPHLQDGRSLYPQAAGRRRDCGVATRPQRRIILEGMGRGATGTQAVQGGGRRARQQDGAHRMGRADTRRSVPQHAATGSLSNLARLNEHGKRFGGWLRRDADRSSR